MILAVAFLAVAGAMAVVIGSRGSSTDTGAAATAQAGQASAERPGQRRRELFDAPRHVRDPLPHNPYGPLPAVEGGKKFGPGAGFLPSTVQSPVTGGWESASHAEVLDIYAGADGEDRSTGLFAILRTKANAQQTWDFVKVPGAGALKITRAPLGRKVARSAQVHGDFDFTSRSGIAGTLHIADDSVTLNP
jgi:hypothetical protein